MSRKSAFTVEEIMRAVRAVRRAGLPISGVSVKPDGTISVETVNSGNIAPDDTCVTSQPDNASDPLSWS